MPPVPPPSISCYIAIAIVIFVFGFAYASYVCNAAGTVILPALTAGMNFTIITGGKR